MPREWDDFLMMEFYGCTPSELDELPDDVVEMHIAFIAARADMQHFEAKRAEQRARANKNR